MVEITLCYRLMMLSIDIAYELQTPITKTAFDKVQKCQLYDKQSSPTYLIKNPRNLHLALLYALHTLYCDSLNIQSWR